MRSIEGFKAWYKESGSDRSVQMWADGSGFISPSTQFAWKVWQASENWREPLSADAMQRLKNLGVLDKPLSPAPEGDKP